MRKKILTKKLLVGLVITQTILLIIALLYIFQISANSIELNQKNSLVEQTKLPVETGQIEQQNDYYNQNLTARELDKIIENNQQTWKIYHDTEDGSFTLRYPVFLSRFEKIDNDRVPENSLVSSYYRPTNGTKEYGRSFRITIQKSFPNTQNEDLYSWIIKTKRNILIEHPDTGVELKHELTVNKTTLGGKEAYVVSPGGEYPRYSTIYFKTSRGIRTIGFSSFGSEADVSDDYRIFQSIIQTIYFR